MINTHNLVSQSLLSFQGEAAACQADWPSVCVWVFFFLYTQVPLGGGRHFTEISDHADRGVDVQTAGQDECHSPVGFFLPLHIHYRKSAQTVSFISAATGPLKQLLCVCVGERKMGQLHLLCQGDVKEAPPTADLCVFGHISC